MLIETYKENHFLIDTWMLKLRYQEEISQTEKEMAQFLIQKEKRVNSQLTFLSMREFEDVTVNPGEIALIREEIKRLEMILQDSTNQFKKALNFLHTDDVNDDLSDYEDF